MEYQKLELKKYISKNAFDPGLVNIYSLFKQYIKMSKPKVGING